MHVLGYSVSFQCKYTRYNEQIKVNGTFLTSNIYPFFAGKAFEIPFCSNFSCFKPPSLWCFVIAAQNTYYNSKNVISESRMLRNWLKASKILEKSKEDDRRVDFSRDQG